MYLSWPQDLDFFLKGAHWGRNISHPEAGNSQQLRDMVQKGPVFDLLPSVSPDLQ